MPPEYSRKLMEERNNKITGDKDKDIHEKDYNYLVHSYNNSCEISERYNWNKIRCVRNEKIKSIEEIHNEIYKEIKEEMS